MTKLTDKARAARRELLTDLTVEALTRGDTKLADYWRSMIEKDEANR